MCELVGKSFNNIVILIIGKFARVITMSSSIAKLVFHKAKEIVIVGQYTVMNLGMANINKIKNS